MDKHYQPAGKNKPYYKIVVSRPEPGVILYEGVPIRDDNERRKLLEAYNPAGLHAWAWGQYQNWRQGKLKEEWEGENR